MPDTACDYCGGTIPLEWERCPHCARPGLYPNVKAAADPDERDALDKRHRQACAAGASRGTEENIRSFEEAVRASKAVIARPLRDLDRLATSDRELYPTFYGLTEAEVRASDFPQVLLRQGSATTESRFVEVHIWGPMSIRTIERVVLTDGDRKYRRAFLLELRDRLAKFGTQLEVA